MKTLKCEICSADIQGADFDSWFKAAHAHWGVNHSDVMKKMGENPNAKEEQMKWMDDAKRKFEAA